MNRFYRAGFRTEHHICAAIFIVLCVGGSLWVHTPAFMLLIIPLGVIYVARLMEL